MPSANQISHIHKEPKIGTSTQMICQNGSVYQLGKTDNSEGILVKQVNLHCVLGSRGEAQYIDDYGHAPNSGCIKGMINLISLISDIELQLF